MKRIVITSSLVLIAVLVAALAPPAQAADSTYAELVEHYEPIRQALLNDTLDGVADHAREIADSAADLQGDLTAGAAGVPAGDLLAVKALLPEIIGAARELADAEDLEGARRFFGELSEPMVVYHGLVPDAEMIVAYCPMVEESWLQPEGTLGNPYMGQRMARCGKKVGE